MKKTIIFLLLFTTISISAQTLIEQANTAYSEGDFEKAVELYETIIREQGKSAFVYYNLGNAYYRLNKTAASILNYERALLLDPGNQDIRFNLEIAKLKTVDKIEPLSEFFLTEWFNDMKNLYSTNQWSVIAIVCFLLFIACLFLFFFSRIITLKKIGFFCGIVFLVFALFANIFAANQKRKLTNRNTAIIFSPTTTIKSSPDNSGTDLFILHEGTKVNIKNQLGNWHEIETADGNVGWIQSNEIEII
jgi:tetratricopeptide (TPR) repeat protein